jgi:hypothetical protein
MNPRRLAARAALALLATAGLVAIGIGAVGAIVHCYDICDPQSEDWLSRPGAWERWVQLGLAVAFGLLLMAAALAGYRDRYAVAVLLIVVAIPALTAWVVVVS